MKNPKTKRLLAVLLSCILLIGSFAGTAVLAADSVLKIGDNNWAVVAATAGETTVTIDGSDYTINAFGKLADAMAAVKDKDNPHVGVVGVLTGANSKSNNEVGTKKYTIKGLTDDATITADGMYSQQFRVPVHLENVTLKSVKNDYETMQFWGGEITLGTGVDSQVSGWTDTLLMSFIYGNDFTHHKINVNCGSALHLKSMSLFPVEDGWVKSEYGTVEDPVLIEWNINGVSTVDHGEYWNDGINMGSRNNKATTVNGNAILTVDSIWFVNSSYATSEHNINGGRRTRDAASAAVYNGTVTVIQHNGLNIPVEETFQAQVDYLVKVATGGSVVVKESTKRSAIPTFIITPPKGQVPVIGGTQLSKTGGVYEYTPAAGTTMQTIDITFEAPAVVGDTIEEKLQSAFANYVDGSLLTDTNRSTSFNAAALQTYVNQALNRTDVTVDAASVYLDHAQNGLKVNGEQWFEQEDGYVSAILKADGKNVACVARIPAKTVEYTGKTTGTATVAEDGTVTLPTTIPQVLTIEGAGSLPADWAASLTPAQKNTVEFVVMKNTGKKLEGYVFEGFNKMIALILSDSITHLDPRAGSQYPNIYDPLGGVNQKSFFGHIGESYGAGTYNNSLVWLRLPVNCGTVGATAFGGCTALAYVENEEYVTTFGSNSFKRTAVLEFDIGTASATKVSCGDAIFRSHTINNVALRVIRMNAAKVEYSYANSFGSGHTNANFRGYVYVLNDDQVKTTVSGHEVWWTPDRDETQASYKGNYNVNITKAMVLAQKTLDNLTAIGKNGDLLINKVNNTWTNDIGTKVDGLAASWNNTWTVVNDNVSGKLSITDGTNTGTIAFAGVYSIAATDDELKDALDNIVPDADAITADDLAQQIADELGCLASDVFVQDFYHLRPMDGVKDSEGILVEGRPGYAAAVVSMDGSETTVTKTWVIEPTIEDLGTLTVSKEEEFDLRNNGAGVFAVYGYNGNAQKLVIPEVGVKINGNWKVANKENVQVVVVKAHAGAIEPMTFHDFPNLKVIIWNDEARNYDGRQVVDADGNVVKDPDGKVQYSYAGGPYGNLPSLKYFVAGSAMAAEYYPFISSAAAPNLVAVPFPKNPYAQMQGKSISLTSFVGTKVKDVVLPAGYAVSGALGAGQQLVQLGTSTDSVCKAWVLAQYAADTYTGAAVNSDLKTTLKAAYGANSAITADWTAWAETNTGTTVAGTVSGVLALTKGDITLNVNYSKAVAAIGLGNTVADRLASAVANYPYSDATTDTDLYEMLTNSLKSETGYSVEVTDFYRLESVPGVRDAEGILVPGTDGLITAVVKVTGPSETTTLYVEGTIVAPIDTITLNSVSTENDFTIYDGVLSVYSGLAEKIIIPEGVTEVEMGWLDDNDDGKQVARVVILPSTLKHLAYAMFSRMENLEAVYIHDNTINNDGEDEYAFEYCYRLKYVHLSEGFDHIPAGTFVHCKSLTRVHIPGGVVYIGELAFNVTNVSNITISPDVEEIGNRVFEGSYTHNTVIGAMDLSANDTDVYYDVSKAVIEELRRIAADKGTTRLLNGNAAGANDYLVRYFTILNQDLIVGTNSFIGQGLPSGRGSHIRAIYDGYAYSDLEASGYLVDGVRKPFDGGTLEELTMSLAEAAAYAQQYATALVLNNNSTADDILESISGIAALADGTTAEWSTPFAMTKATETAKGSASGVIVLKKDGVATFEIEIDEVVNYMAEENDDDDDDDDDDDNDNDNDDDLNNGGNTDDESGNTDTGNTVSVVLLVIAMAAAAIVLIVSRKAKRVNN